METWFLEGDVQRLVVVVSGLDSNETLERWQFNVTVEGDASTSALQNINENPNIPRSSKPLKKPNAQKQKSVKEIHNEIQAIIRQITASVTFLPLLDEPCSFDLLVYTNKTVVAPKTWEDSDPRYILNSQEVKLRSFTTTVHKVDSLVTYQEADEWEL